VRFVDLLRITVLLSAASATVLALVTVLSASARGDTRVVLALAAWWALAAVVGAVLGRRSQTTPPIARLLATARTTTSLPEQRPQAIVLNRLWPVLVSTVLAVALAFLAPQIPGIAAGFTIIWALAWRRQDRAVAAIEDRDGVAFHVAPISPLHPIRLVRTPALRREAPRSLDQAGV
jgi:hypothetical protein